MQYDGFCSGLEWSLKRNNKKVIRKADVLSESFQVVSRDEDLGQLAGDGELQCIIEQLHIEN